MMIAARALFTLIVVVGQLLLLLGPAPQQSSAQTAAESPQPPLAAPAAAGAPAPPPGPAGAAFHTTVVKEASPEDGPDSGPEAAPPPTAAGAWTGLPGHSGAGQPPDRAAVSATRFGGPPPAFVENARQAEAAPFYLRARGQTLWLTERGIVFDLSRSAPPAGAVPAADPSLQSAAGSFEALASNQDRERLTFSLELIGANPHPVIEPREPGPGTFNFFLGDDPAAWTTSLRGYAEVVYRDVWEGIDLRLLVNGPDLEQEFVLRPGADLARLRVGYRGVEGLRLDEDGGLRVTTPFGELTESPPRLYQEIEGERVPVAGSFRLLDDATYSFEAGPYQPDHALVVDPTLVYATFFGGSGLEEANAIAVGTDGSVYVTGKVDSTNFPTTTNALQLKSGGGTDVFVMKVNPDGQLGYATYLGGNNFDVGYGIAVDSAGNAYVTGETSSNNFPKANALQPLYGAGKDAFATKLNPTGTGLVYSTYLGGRTDHTGGCCANDIGRSIAVDGSGSAYVAGETSSSDFPTANALRPTYGGGNKDAFVSKLNPAGSALVYSTYLGGGGQDQAHGIAVDSAGNAYLTGQTDSTNYPVRNALQSVKAGIAASGVFDAFVTKLNPAGSALVYSTYLGGGAVDSGDSIAVDPAGNVYVTGSTAEPVATGFPLGQSPLQATPGPSFIVKLELTRLFTDRYARLQEFQAQLTGLPDSHSTRWRQRLVAQALYSTWADLEALKSPQPQAQAT